jgi:hypothetical protein
MTDNPEATNFFYKTQALAYWSFIGLLIPIIGIITGTMAVSRLSQLRASDREELRLISKTKNVAVWGIVLSSAVMVLLIVAYIMASSSANQSVSQTISY